MKSKIWDILKNYEWPIVWLAAVTALILGILGFKQHFGNTRTQWDILYLALQLFTMESGFQPGAIGPVLNVARFLAPLVTVYTAAKALTVIFRNQLQLVRLKTQQGHVVIAGLGRSGILFAEAFRKAGQSVVVIEQNEDNDQLENCRDVGALTLIGDARTPDVLNKARVDHARVLICVAGEDGANAEIAVQTRGMFTDQNRALTSLVHLVDSQLCQLLRKQELMTPHKNRMRVEFFNVYESAIRELFARYPIFQQNNHHDHFFDHRSGPDGRICPACGGTELDPAEIERIGTVVHHGTRSINKQKSGGVQCTLSLSCGKLPDHNDRNGNSIVRVL